jgi:hypothetical protein
VVEVAIGSFAAVALHIVDARFSVLLEMHKWTVILPAGAPLKISTNFPPLHDYNERIMMRALH